MVPSVRGRAKLVDLMAKYEPIPLTPEHIQEIKENTAGVEANMFPVMASGEIAMRAVLSSEEWRFFLQHEAVVSAAMRNKGKLPDNIETTENRKKIEDLAKHFLDRMKITRAVADVVQIFIEGYAGKPQEQRRFRNANAAVLIVSAKLTKALGEGAGQSADCGTKQQGAVA
ncbi:hypothetical protein B0A48_17076 [Cryoendolithus antarcticus]|uniref:Uncharacterized protein n=1 Tax=Cryoendolithus antarcticus TaxID=1507870 RepID=A0A1V8SBQ2_9PEZI|nr:hypothetical protein B0A48_17076 [Cryoendolithus antarcticus]